METLLVEFLLGIIAVLLLWNGSRVTRNMDKLNDAVSDHEKRLTKLEVTPHGTV